MLVESFCLPFDGHVFASLVRNTDVSDLDSRASPTSEQNFSASDDGEAAIPFSTEDFERLNDIS
ncbi:unnamed protein product [Effrenium voratum]|uniref:Uncharacterized protein n=1 Tax=Effrenium voratum TaxID=2562239 RepID=A0AA36IV47_9DINO|nr:unnamed protein product [Effrenium voratum]